jgi:hypothetical protein
MATPINVLIAEDSADDTLVLIRELQHGGFEPNYQRVETAGAWRRPKPCAPRCRKTIGIW